ncbi:MAG: TIR domain-containing protein [Clostridiales bacterium]|nr:TIR domain-containing protein [Clostridiales bacterium]
MAYQVLQCPSCGAGEIKQNGDKYHCPYCNCDFTDDSAQRAYQKLVENINQQFGGAIDECLRKEKEERFYALRTNLWEKVNAQYVDSRAIVDICRDIKKIAPYDFVANFYETANGASVREFAKFLHNINVEEQSLYIERCLEFALRSLSPELVAPVNYLIERAYKNTDLHKYEEYIDRLEEEASKVDKGVYETSLPRDVFIAYASEDIQTVLDLASDLEENGFSCFVALRNLQHGRGAADNYEKEIYTAIDNCKMIVFVSSKHSRAIKRDALRLELPYIKKKDLENAPSGLKLNYQSLPQEYKKPRIEYRLDNERTMAADIVLKEFFAGLDYCETSEKVLERVVKYTVEENAIAATAPQVQTQIQPQIQPQVQPQAQPKQNVSAQNWGTAAPTQTQRPVTANTPAPTPAKNYSTKTPNNTLRTYQPAPQTQNKISKELTQQEKNLLERKDSITKEYVEWKSETEIRAAIKAKYNKMFWIGIFTIALFYAGIAILIYRFWKMNQEIDQELSKRQQAIEEYRKLQVAIKKSSGQYNEANQLSSTYTLTIYREVLGGLDGLLYDNMSVKMNIGESQYLLKRGGTVKVTLNVGKHILLFKGSGMVTKTYNIDVNGNKSLRVLYANGEISVNER